jgi:hypothetical protein
VDPGASLEGADGAGSAASSSGDGASVHATGKADAFFDFPPWGKISYYDRYSRFEATCHEAHSGHQACRLSKLSYPGANPAQGRPVGLLAAWLKLSDVGVSSRYEHLNPFTMALATQEVRLEARECVAGMPGGPELLSFERACRDGEPQEPEGLP